MPHAAGLVGQKWRLSGIFLVGGNGLEPLTLSV